MPKKKIIFMHKETGDIKFVRTKLEGQLLGKDWSQIEFTTNSKGERVMRFKFDHFTIDVQPNGEREVTRQDGNGSSK